MKFTAVIASAALTATLFPTGCKSERADAPVIWMGNADLSEYNDVVADFSNAFASDALCHGIRLETHDYLKETYWFLETYSTDATGSGPHEFTDGISRWMVRKDHDKVIPLPLLLQILQHHPPQHRIPPRLIGLPTPASTPENPAHISG